MIRRRCVSGWLSRWFFFLNNAPSDANNDRPALPPRLWLRGAYTDALHPNQKENVSDNELRCFSPRYFELNDRDSVFECIENLLRRRVPCVSLSFVIVYATCRDYCAPRSFVEFYFHLPAPLSFHFYFFFSFFYFRPVVRTSVKCCFSARSGRENITTKCSGHSWHWWKWSSVIIFISLVLIILYHYCYYYYYSTSPRVIHFPVTSALKSSASESQRKA